MADTWGDIIGRNYSAGRAIADDFVSARYAKKADELRSTYEQRAKSEGKQLQDYLPELESELRTLAAGVGATRRGVTDRKGQALDMGTMGRIRDDVSRMGDQRAGALAMAGDQAGARQTRAGAQYAIGDFDAGQGQQIAGDTIAATSGALDGEGRYDPQKGALGLAKVGAQYGNAETAASQTEQADTFRMKSAAAKATQLYNLISNPESADADQIRGLWEGIKQDVPEYKNVDLQLQDGKVYIYEGGKVTGDLDPQEAAQLLQTAIQAPGQAIQSSMQAQLKAAEDSKLRREKIDDKVFEWSGDAIKALKAAGISDTVIAATTAAQKAVASTGGGWQLQEIGDAPNTFLMQKGGQVYTVKTNVQPDLATGEAGGTLQVFDAQGNPVPGDVLNKQDAQAMQQSLVDLAVAKAQAGTDMNFEVLNQQLKLFNELGAAYGGSQTSRPASSGGASSGGNSRAERNNNPGNIEDRGQFKGFPGYKGSDGRFAIFDSPEAGQKAFENQLERYFDGKTTGQPLQTVADIIGTWSPQNDPTNQSGSTSNYANYVAKKLGVDPSAQLTKADIPRLTAAMAEFESGNTSGAPAPKKGALPPGPAGTPKPKEPAIQTAVAQSAPAQQTRTPGRKMAISPDIVRKQANDLPALRDAYLAKRAAVEQFDKDNGTELGYTPGRSLDSPGTSGPTNLSPSLARVREALVADLNRSATELTTLSAELKQNTGALNRGTAAAAEAKAEQALYRKYGGSADFFSRAGQGGSP